MGLIQAGFGAASGVLADQWREYFYCPSLEENVLMKKGQNRKAKRNFNTKGSDNIISNGSIIAVNEGQCMIIVEQGAIVEVCAEPGEFVFDKSTEPSIFYGGLGAGIKKSWETFKKRFTMGGDTGKDQRIYFFNTKEIIGNKYGTANPVPFRVVELNGLLDTVVSLKCHGEYSYKLADPIAFYKNIAANVDDEYTRDRLDSQLKSELLTALQPAFGKLSDQGIRYHQITSHTMELADALNDVLSEKWGGKRGIVIAEFGVSSVVASEEDEKRIKQMQDALALSNPGVGAGFMTSATATAMNAAASNTSAGPMMAFAGMNFAQGASGINAGNLYQMAAQQGYPAQQGYAQAAPQQAPQQPKMEAPSGWTCSCGRSGNTGKFCGECGSPKPADPGFWTCSCGAQNTGKFCPQCGSKKPAGVPQYKCDKCGWTPEDPTNPPKFCPECGDPFGDEDIVG